MTVDKLLNRVDELIVRRQPTTCNRFLLYADHRRLGVSDIESLPRSAWVIKSLSAEEINNGMSRREWYRVCDTIFFLEERGLLS